MIEGGNKRKYKKISGIFKESLDERWESLAKLS